MAKEGKGGATRGSWARRQKDRVGQPRGMCVCVCVWSVGKRGRLSVAVPELHFNSLFDDWTISGPSDQAHIISAHHLILAGLRPVTANGQEDCIIDAEAARKFNLAVRDRSRGPLVMYELPVLGCHGNVDAFDHRFVSRAADEESNIFSREAVSDEGRAVEPVKGRSVPSLHASELGDEGLGWGSACKGRR